MRKNKGFEIYSKNMKYLALAIGASYLLRFNAHAQATPSPITGGVIKGDMNFDGKVSSSEADKGSKGYSDYGAFSIALGSPKGYREVFGFSPILRCDADDNGVVDFDDIEPLIRLMKPVAPTGLKKLNIPEIPPFNNSGKLEYRFYYRGNTISGDGRYITVAKTQAGTASYLPDRIKVYDTYTDTHFEVPVPAGFSTSGILYHSVDISANGRKISAVVNFKDITGQTRLQSFVYDLVTGNSQLLAQPDGSTNASLSAAGNFAVYSGFEMINGESKHFVYLRNLARNTVEKVLEINRKALIVESKVINISDDGRFVLAPFASISQPTNGTSASYLFDGARGLVLVDRLRKKNIEIEPGSDAKATSINATISGDGRVVAYVIAESIGTERKSIINIFDTVSLKKRQITNFIGSKISVGAGDSLSISTDGEYFATNRYLICQTSKSRCFSFEGLISSALYYPQDINVSADGRYITFNASPSSANSIYSQRNSYIVRNPLYTSGVEGDYNQDGCVDTKDVKVYSDLYGKTVIAGTSADGDGNGSVDGADLLVLQRSFGKGCSNFTEPNYESLF